jgi:phage terminase large subunit GpA-like protein
VDGAVLAGLKDLSEHLLAREFVQESGPPMQVGLCLIDTGYNPDIVRVAVRLVARLVTLRGSRGQGITAGKTQFDDYKRDRCREMGLHWWVPKESPDATIQIDTNFWKSFVHGRIATAQGDPGALTLFGVPGDHGLLAEHILAEYFSLPSTEKGLPVQEWHQHVGKDNEFFDCLVGAAAAAAKMGCSLLPVVPRARTRRHFAATVTARAFDPALG